MALILVALALGPVLRLNGQLYVKLPMLYRMLEPLFIFRLIRVPERYNMVLALPMAMMAAYGAAELLTHLRHRNKARSWHPVAATAALSLLVLFEYDGGPAPLQSTSVSPYFEELAAAPGKFAVLSLPIDPLQAKDQMFAQTTHGRPLVSGKISRIPQGVYSFIDNHPLLRVLRQSSEMPPWETDVSQQLSSLAQEGIAYIIMHKDQIGTDRIEHWRRYLATEPLYEDELIAIFRTNPQAARDFEIQEELAPGLGLVQRIITSDCFLPGQPLQVDVAWGTSALVTTSKEVRIMLRDAAGEPAQTNTYPLINSGTSSEWPANTLVWGYYPMQIDDGLQPGEYTLALSLSGTDPADAAVLGQLTIVDQVCPRTLPDEAIMVDALFGQEMRLLGYELNRPAADRLEITLYWRSEQRADTDYKIFIHVYQPDTGAPVAQDDSVPHRGGLSTRFWAPGDVIVDHIPINLTGVPDGEYGLAVGVYDPLNLVRQSVTTIDGQMPEDRRLILVEPGGIVVP
jgi:hypothetical protein